MSADREEPWRESLLSCESQHLVANAATETAELECDGHFFPLTVNHTEWENSYVCSPYTAFVSYASEELEKLQTPWLESLLSHFIKGLGGLLKSGDINRVVHVNNWLLSTNLYPAWNGRGLSELHQRLRACYPDHVLVFRSLNPVTNGTLIPRFQELGYRLLPSRQVYLFDGRRELRKTKNYLTDLKLLRRRTPYRVVAHEELGPEDYERIADLYHQLYLQKYSRHNPEFTTELMALWHREKILRMTGLRSPSGRLDGIVGIWEREGVTTVPLVGYEFSVPQKVGLYRMLMAIAIEEAHRDGVLLNLSAGASHFKRLRGGVPELEYSAVYYEHLPWSKRWVWKALDLTLCGLAAPLMRYFKV